jgi:hypothetical protein
MAVVPATFTWLAGTSANWSTLADWSPLPASAPGTFAANKDSVSLLETTTGNKTAYIVTVQSGGSYDIATLNIGNVRAQHSAPDLQIAGSLFTDTLAYQSSADALTMDVNAGGLFDIRSSITDANGGVVGTGANGQTVAQTVTIEGTGAGGHLELGSASQSGITVNDPTVTFSFNNVGGKNAGLIEYMSGFNAAGTTTNQHISNLGWGDAIKFDGANFTGDTFSYTNSASGNTLTVKNGATTVLTMNNLSGTGLASSSFVASGNEIVVIPAGSFSWGAATTGNWSTPARWTPNPNSVYPGTADNNPNDTALINATGVNNYTVTDDVASNTIAALTESSANATLAFSQANTALNVSGTTSLAAGTINVANATAALSTGSLSQTGGTITESAGTLTAGSFAQTGGSFTESGGNLSVTGLASLAAGGTDTISGGAFNAGTTVGATGGATQTLILSGGTTTVSGQTSITGGGIAGSQITMSGGSLAATGGIVFGTGTITGTITGKGTISGGTISGPGTITATNGTLDIGNAISSGPILTIGTAQASDLKLDGTVTSAGAISLTATTQTLEIGANGALTINAAENVSGAKILLDGGSLGGSGISFGGAANGALTGSGTVSANLTKSAINNTGTITASGGTLDLTGTFGSGLVAAISNGADLKFDNTATLANAVTLNNATQTLEVGATGAVTINTAQSVNPGNIKMSGGTLTDGLGISFGNGGGLSGFGTVAANLTGGSTDTITASGGTLDLTGTFGNGLVAAIDATKTSDLKFDSAGTLSTPISITSGNQTLEVGSAGNLTINGAQIVSGGGTIKLDGGTLVDSNGTTGLTVGSGGTLTGFGTGPNDITLAGGTVSQSGGVLNALFITGFGTVNGITGTAPSGANQIVASGGTLDLIGTVSGAQLVVDPNKVGSVLKVDGNVAAGGTGVIQISSANQTVEIGAAGNLTLSSLVETMTNGTIKLDGGILTDTSGLTVGGGATLTGFGSAPVVTLAGGTVTQSGGTLSTSSITGFGTVNGVTGAPTITASKGLLDLTGTVASGMVLQADSVPSSVLELGGTISTSTSFTYLNTGGVFSGTLQLDAGALVSFGANGVISGMHEATGIGTSPTDVLDLRSVAFSSGYSTDILGGNTIQLWSDVGHTSLLASFHLAAPVATGTFVDWQADSAGGTNLFLDDDPCYVAGTHILTATGERMVESLMQGDIVLTLADGDLSARPVKWIGTRRIDLTAHPRPETAAPIRIRRGAFADNMPHRDLLVSPDHAVFVDGKLICARQLVNGTTIRQEKGRAAVEYFHVELDSHAILLAEGLPAESYLNTGNHGFFINSGEPLVLHPDMTDETDYPTREAGSCAPFVSDESSVLPVWERLAERAAALGQPAPRLATTDDPELRIVAKGRTVRPLYGENGLYIFALPKGATEVRVVSRAGAPTDARPWLDDRRCLGVNVERIVLRGANELREVPVDHPGLSQGWHVVGRDGVALRRWTNGDAVLPLPVLGGPTMLEIRAGGGGMAYVTDTGEQDQRAA